MGRPPGPARPPRARGKHRLFRPPAGLRTPAAAPGRQRGQTRFEENRPRHRGCRPAKGPDGRGWLRLDFPGHLRRRPRRHPRKPRPGPQAPRNHRPGRSARPGRRTGRGNRGDERPRPIHPRPPRPAPGRGLGRHGAHGRGHPRGRGIARRKQERQRRPCRARRIRDARHGHRRRRARRRRRRRARRDALQFPRPLLDGTHLQHRRHPPRRGSRGFLGQLLPHQERDGVPPRNGQSAQLLEAHPVRRQEDPFPLGRVDRSLQSRRPHRHDLDLRQRLAPRRGFPPGHPLPRQRPAGAGENRDAAWLFQPEIAVRSPTGGAVFKNGPCRIFRRTTTN